MHKPIAVSMTLLVLIGGCASSRSSTGTLLDANQVSRIQKGVTTRDQVVALLGEPTSTSMVGEGRRMMVYSGTQTEAKAKVNPLAVVPLVGNWFMQTDAKSTHRQQMLQIMLNKQGIVEDYEFSDRTSEGENSVGPMGTESSSRTRQTQP